MSKWITQDESNPARQMQKVASAKNMFQRPARKTTLVKYKTNPFQDLRYTIFQTSEVLHTWLLMFKMLLLKGWSIFGVLFDYIGTNPLDRDGGLSNAKIDIRWHLMIL